MRMSLFLGALALSMSGASSALASLELDSGLQYAGGHRYSLATGQVSDYTAPGQFSDRGGPPPAILYSNLTGPVTITGGFSLSGNTSTFGDRLGLTAPPGPGGPLQEFACTVFSGTGTGSGLLVGGTLNVQFLRAADNSVIGGLSVPLAPLTGLGLPAGQFVIVDINDIALATNITFDTNDIIVQQTITGATGGRSGIVIFNPIQNGTSPQTLFLNGPGAPSGFYNLGNPAIQSNPGYFLFIPSPGAAALLGLGGLVATRRRR